MVNVTVNRHVPERLSYERDATQGERLTRVPQGAVPNVAYIDPGGGEEKIVELTRKFINM